MGIINLKLKQGGIQLHLKIKEKGLFYLVMDKLLILILGIFFFFLNYCIFFFMFLLSYEYYSGTFMGTMKHDTLGFI